MFKALFISLFVLLGACVPNDTPKLIHTRPVVYIPNDSFFICPTIDRLPNVNTLTDYQVAILLVQLNQANTACKASMIALKKELIKAKKRFGGKSK